MRIYSFAVVLLRRFITVMKMGHGQMRDIKYLLCSNQNQQPDSPLNISSDVRH